MPAPVSTHGDRSSHAIFSSEAPMPTPTSAPAVEHGPHAITPHVDAVKPAPPFTPPPAATPATLHSPAASAPPQQPMSDPVASEARAPRASGGGTVDPARG